MWFYVVPDRMIIGILQYLAASKVLICSRIEVLGGPAGRSHITKYMIMETSEYHP
jgi:hypothetical protein